MRSTTMAAASSLASAKHGYNCILSKFACNSSYSVLLRFLVTEERSYVTEVTPLSTVICSPPQCRGELGVFNRRQGLVTILLS